MNLHSLLLERESQNRPVTVGLIGPAKFGTMFLAQARLTHGMHVVAVADLDVSRAQKQFGTAGWHPDAFSAKSLAEVGRLPACSRRLSAVSLRRRG